MLSTYETPWIYNEEAVVSLAGFNFTVTDAATGAPLEGAFCLIYAGLNGTGEADGVYTDSQGKAGIDARWFVPRSWSVSKEGYLRKVSNDVVSIIQVALESTTIIYTVRIFAGTGGTTDPSGTQTVAPNTQLTVRAIPNSGYDFDHWVFKGQNVGSTNPLTFLIDRDSLTISAVFSEVVTPPPDGEPPDGEPPTDGVWPVVKTEQVFDNERLAPGLLAEAVKQREKQVDTSLVIGGQIEYSVKLESSILTGCTFYILWNNEVLDTKGFLILDPFGK
ncbi:unnamed protein product, partial [marine sediment metagenome]